MTMNKSSKPWALIPRIALTIVCALVGDRGVFAQDCYAVLIGVEKNDPGTFDILDYAEDDAIGLGNALAKLGFKTKIMTGQADAPALKPSTPEKIKRILQTQLNSCAADDTLVISFSGHGVQFKDEEPQPDGTRESYFCPEDANLSDKTTLLKISEVLALTKVCLANRKLVLIDMCQEEILSTEGKPKGNKIDLGSVSERISVPTGMNVLFSCKEKQFSWEHDPLSHGVFSHFVIEYMQGRAGPSLYERKKPSLDGLVAYVRKNRTITFLTRTFLLTASCRSSVAIRPTG